MLGPFSNRNLVLKFGLCVLIYLSWLATKYFLEDQLADMLDNISNYEIYSFKLASSSLNIDFLPLAISWNYLNW